MQTWHEFKEFRGYKNCNLRIKNMVLARVVLHLGHVSESDGIRNQDVL